MRDGNLNERLEEIILRLNVELEDLDGRRQEVADQLERLKRLASIVDDLPAELQAMLEGDNDDPQKSMQSAEAQQTHFQKIKQVFIDGDNEYCTIADLELVTGIPRSSVSAVLYRTHAKHFVASQATRGKAKLWRLLTEEDVAEVAKHSEDDIPF